MIDDTFLFYHIGIYDAKLNTNKFKSTQYATIPHNLIYKYSRVSIIAPTIFGTDIIHNELRVLMSYYFFELE